MFARLNVAGSLAMAGLLLVGSAHAETRDAPGWRFRATFPCQSAISSQTVDTPVGKVILTMYSCGDDNQAFMAIVSDYPAGTVKPEEIPSRYAGAVDGMANQVKGTIHSVAITTLGGIEGREVVIDLPEKQGVLTSHVFLIGDRLYQATCVGATSADPATPCRAFLNSFMFVGIDAPPPSQ
jgi:hypothetical protein